MSPTSYQTAPPRICMLPQAVGADSLPSSSHLVNNWGTELHPFSWAFQVLCSVFAWPPNMIRPSSPAFLSGMSCRGIQEEAGIANDKGRKIERLEKLTCELRNVCSAIP